jgi:hypothetical protein
VDIDLLPPARELCFCPSRFLGFFAGRRYGKSETFKRMFLLKALSRPGYRMMYLTPTAQQNEEQMDSLLSFDGIEPFIAKTKTRPSRLWLTNGSYLGMNSFQRSKNIRGRYFDSVVGDESQDLDGTSFWRVVRPMLSDRRGQAVVMGQLPSKTHWTYKDFYERGQAEPGTLLNPSDGGVPRYKSWAIPSSQGPVFWTEDGKRELEIARQQMPQWMFEAEYECKPTAAQNAVFPPDRLTAVTIKAPADLPVRPDGNYARPKDALCVIGHDIGRVIDPGATVVTSNKGLVLMSRRFPRGMKHEDQARELQKLSEAYGNALVCIDSTGGGGGSGGYQRGDDIVKIYHDNIRKCQSVYMPWQVKQELVTCLSVAVERGIVAIPEQFRDLLEEMSEYEGHYQNGIWRYSAPTGKHDDLVMGLALCTWALKRGWVGEPMDWAALGRFFY